MINVRFIIHFVKKKKKKKKLRNPFVACWRREILHVLERLQQTKVSISILIYLLKLYQSMCTSDMYNIYKKQKRHLITVLFIAK